MAPSSSTEQDSTTSNGNSDSNAKANAKASAKANANANGLVYTVKVLLGTAVIILLTSFFAHTALTVFTSMPPQTLSDFLTVRSQSRMKKNYINIYYVWDGIIKSQTNSQTHTNINFSYTDRNIIIYC